MKFIQLASELIAGYDLLPALIRSNFEKSDAGLLFSAAITEAEGVIAELEKQRDDSWIWKAYYQKQIDEAIKTLAGKALTPDVTNSEEYNDLIHQIILKVLPTVYPDIKFLTAEEQLQVASAKFSTSLQSKYISANNDVKFYQNPLIPHSGDQLFYNVVEGYRDSIVAKWHDHLAADENMSLIRTRIAEGKGFERSRALGVFFPFLRDPSLANPTLPADQLYNAYQAEIETAEEEHRAPNTEKIEEEFLTQLLFHQLQAKAGQYIDALQINSHNILDEFNQTQANFLANKILDAFNNGETLEMHDWLDDYQVELSSYIRKKIELIDGKIWPSPNLDLAGLTEPLSALWNNWVTNGSAEFAAKVGEAHYFVQYMGGASQNDNPFFWGLDAYNLLRNKDEIVETKNTLFNLLIKPFKPLIQEYQEIAKYEKSFLKQIVRTVMPLLIIAALLVLVGMLLTPFGLPELAFIVIAIPTLFIGLALATKYVTFKNSLTLSLRQWWYGGPFEIPELQVSDRMICVFADKERLDAAQTDQERAELLEEFRPRAEKIRSIYIEEMQKCNENEAYFAQHEVGLTQEEIQARKDNLKKIYALGFEWYDIHSNTNLGIDVVKAVAAKRLCTIANNDYRLLQDYLKDSEGALIDEAINNLAANLKTTLLPPIDPSAGPEMGDDEEDRTVFNHGRAPQVSLVAVRAPLVAASQADDIAAERRPSSEDARSASAQQPSGTSPFRLFSLKCAQKNNKIKEVSNALEEIGHEVKMTDPSSSSSPVIGLM
ncbi:hypothetical protein [Legionella drozanskii]|uniref:Uncharacterized protein n=1 Tax=Legionella drozanskii LLAP-1 TaxID=1212489 RepID=A0A0W0SQ18_9GAMM|nr:hypothetical protein [Legionella drozanskii]KTC85364.1 hypothetical protein Ldro_2536 [Legionella drozanskii LLAP-1]